MACLWKKLERLSTILRLWGVVYHRGLALTTTRLSGPHRHQNTQTMEKHNGRFSFLPLSTSGPIKCSLSGIDLLESPAFNKGSASSTQEREAFGLSGLIPATVGSLKDQVKRAYEQYQERRTPLGKNTFMTSLKDQNEVLYYRLIQEHLKEMFPIIYAPTEGEAIANYSRLFRRPAGIFLDINHPDGVETALSTSGKWPGDVDIIACSDGEQILGWSITFDAPWWYIPNLLHFVYVIGIGDQGVGGILISIAKLVLYTLCAGIHPGRTLPVVLDIGTDNLELMNDPLYLGLQQPKARGEEYGAFVETFISACRKQYPKAYIHFEDFGLQNARRILDKYMGQMACFNDDVQGTGCVTLATLYAAIQVAKYKMRDLRVVIFGAGTAGIGIADQVRHAIAVESGKSKEEATRQIWCVEKLGLLLLLLIQSHDEDLSLAQQDYARPENEWQEDDGSLLEVVRNVRPHVLIGTSTKPRSFTKGVVQEMAKHVQRPIIFPLSNPTKLHEAIPSDLIQWTDGKVLTATGSHSHQSFSKVEH